MRAFDEMETTIIQEACQKQFMEMVMDQSVLYKIYKRSIMNRKQAAKIKQYIINYDDVPINVYFGYYIRVGDGVSCKRGNKVRVGGRDWVVSQFRYDDGVLRDMAILPGKVASHARLRPDNGVVERDGMMGTDLVYDGNYILWDKGTVNRLDEIINNRAKRWVRVMYSDGRIILADENGYVGLAKHRGQHITLNGVRYQIYGYGRELGWFTSETPIDSDDKILRHCLLEEV